MNTRSFFILTVLLCAFMLISPTNVKAKGILEHQSTVIPENQTVDDVAVIGGDVTIHGSVKNSVIVLNGDVDIKASAKINGFVLVIGGKVQQEQGAIITDDVIDLSLDSATKNSFMIGGGLVVGTWLLQLAVSVLFIVLTVLTVILGKQRIDPYVNRVRQSIGYPLYVGFFIGLILIALTVLLLVTIIGIPFVILLLILLLLSFVSGSAVLSMLVGERIQGIFGRSNWIVSLAGSVLLISCMNVPLIGVLLFLGVMFFSIGITTLWILEKIQRKPA